MDNKIIVPSEEILWANFASLEDGDRALLLEYAELSCSVSDLTQRLNAQFDQGNLILARILQLVTDD
jgi:hypothetical protein